MNNPHPNKKNLTEIGSYFVLLIWGNLLLILSVGLGYFLVKLLPFWFLVVTTTLIPLFLGIAGFLWEPLRNFFSKYLHVEHLSSHIILSILYFLMMLMTGPQYQKYEAMSQGKVAQDIRVNELIEYDEGYTRFKFVDPKILIQYKSLVYFKKSRKNGGYIESYYYAAPLVGKDWRSGDPIPAWVACGLKNCIKKWEMNYQEAVKLQNHARVPHFDDAIKKSLKKFLLDHPNNPKQPLVLEWVQSSQEKLEKEKRFAMNEFKYILGAWNIWIIFAIAYVSRRGKKSFAP